MIKEENKILNARKINQIVRRMAFEIYENNFEEDELIVAGIENVGYKLARNLVKELRDISPLKLKLVKIKIDKEKPMESKIELDCDLTELQNKNVLLVDDVLNTGKTMAYGLKPFLRINLAKLEIAVLVDRSHKSFPIRANYMGYELSTSINEHVEVRFSKERAVYLH